MPVIPQMKEKIYTIGIIKINPLKSVKICDGIGFSIDVKYVEKMILRPVNGEDIK